MATATTLSGSGSTGSTCSTSGPYRTGRSPYITVFVVKGQKFPAHPVDGRSTSWGMTRTTDTIAAI